jgi:glycosyltransferase involved in cell wall biosynthesis
MVKLFWGTDASQELIGNLYGYSKHNRTLKRYVEMENSIEIVDSPEQADAFMYITVPEVFERRTEKPIFLFTMFEGTTLPDIYKENIKKADFLITPSTWVKNIFSKYFPEDRIFVVPHGVEPHYVFKERQHRPRVFRYLWVGAANPRKGYQELILIWDKLGLSFIPKIELYIKTTRIPNMEIQQNKNVILDSRHLSEEDLVKLYHSAHCFVFPTRGEGFGLTLAEAMATGLPCISTYFGGVTEFFDGSVGFPVKHNIGRSTVTSPVYGSLGVVDVGYPDIVDFAKNMAMVKDNYRLALELGREASKRIHKVFTWENSAKKLALVIQQGLKMGV